MLRASRVRQLRRAQRLTQRMLAQKAGVAVGSLQGIELATRDVRYPTLEAIALALQTTVADLDAPSTALVIPPPSTLIQVASVAPPWTPPPIDTRFNQEDLLVARYYHHAESDVRQRVHQLLLQTSSDQTIEEDVTTLPARQTIAQEFMVFYAPRIKAQLLLLDAETAQTLLTDFLRRMADCVAAASASKVKTAR